MDQPGNTQWDVGGWGGYSYSTSQLQLFLRFLPGGGWNVGSSPIMSYKWKTEEWTVPAEVVNDMYRLLGAYRGLSEYLVDLAGRASSIEWPRLRAEHF